MARCWRWIEGEPQDAAIAAPPLDTETTFVCLDSALDDSQKVTLPMQGLLKAIWEVDPMPPS
ncbi:MAG: hypothetical protein PVI07_18125 [Anaerolineae bacterium]